MKNVNRQLNQSTWRRITLLLFCLLMSLIIVLVFAEQTKNTSKYDETNIAESYQETSKVEISADGTTMIDGKPFFPFGFYHVSWGSTVKERTEHLQEIANAGFNIIHASFKREESLNDYEKFLDKADRLGVQIITEFGIDPVVNPLVVIEKFKHKPAVFGWNISDDVDVYEVNSLNPQQILSLHDRVKNIDPHHVTYISGTTYKLLNFANSADAVGFQSYPIGHREPEQPISLTHENISKIVSSVPQDSLVIANSQAFRRYDENSPIPTFKEVRNMTYQALVAGAKGIIYYTYYDKEKWYLKEYPDLWQGMQSLVSEIEQLSPILLKGERQEVNTRVKDVLLGIWKKENRSLAIVINTSVDRHQEISLALPTENVQAIFASSGDDLKFENGKLTGELLPLGISVYSFKT
jgi:hypothetical protein